MGKMKDALKKLGFKVNGKEPSGDSNAKLIDSIAEDADIASTSYVDNEIADVEDYVDEKVAQAISSVYKYRGSVADYEHLPTRKLEVGDVYNVEDTGDNYAWTGTEWDKLAGTVDLSEIYDELDSINDALDSKQGTLTAGTGIRIDNDVISLDYAVADEEMF